MKTLSFILILMSALIACDDDPTSNNVNNVNNANNANNANNTNNTNNTNNVTCNEAKTPSGITLPADACGAYTECVESADCPSDHRCENLPVDGETFARPCCVPGPRGCDASGTLCDDEFDCESGLCISRNDGPTYCTHTCEGPGDCADPIAECGDLFVMMVCVAPEE